MMEKRYRKKVLVFFLAIIMIWGCKEAASVENAAPSKVILVEKSPDSSPIETGIDAEDPIDNPHPDKNGIIIQWYSVQDEDLKAYDIFRRASDTTGNFSKIGDVVQSFGVKDTIFLDTAVDLETIYYYYVTARDEANLSGDPSQKEHYKLLPKPTLDSPVGLLNFSGSFDWTFAGLGAQYFIFRLEKRGPGDEYFPHFLKLHEVNNNNPNQTWDQGEIGLSDPLEPGIYRWRIDVRKYSDLREGSESSWGFFIVP